MEFDNYMEMSFSSKSKNEAFARVTVAAFVSQLDPTVADITDIKTAVSEAVTNAIIHGYDNKDGNVHISCGYKDLSVTIEIWDEGRGIEDVEKARQPLYTSRPELERSGMGFTVMEMFMDEIKVDSRPGQGTRIQMKKVLGNS